MNALLTAEQLNSFGQLDACLLANAIEKFQQRLRNQGFVNQRVCCLTPQTHSMVGYAATIRIRGSEPPTAASEYPDRTDWWDYIAAQPVPRVLVIEDTESRPGLGALIGRVHMNILRALKCVGVVTNGSVRDIPAAQKLGFHLFAGSVSVSHAFVHIVEIGAPVEIGGLKIRSGDLLHGDIHGVQSIPLAIASRVLSIAAQIDAWKREVISVCHSPDFSLEKLRAVIAKERKEALSL
jgi:regulator of RNase E activity RraA